MKKIGENIEVEKDKDYLKIKIFPKAEKNKMLLFTLWLFAWSLIGVASVYALMFIELPKQDKLFMIVFLGFWGYFEIKMLAAYRWLKKGVEVIEVTPEQFKYTKETNGKGLTETVEVNELGKFQYQEKTEKGLMNDISKSIWFIGGEVIEYRTKTAVRRLGMKLSKQEAERLTSLINKTARL